MAGPERNAAVRSDNEEEVFDVQLPPIDLITAISTCVPSFRLVCRRSDPCGASPRVDADPAIRDFIGLAENAWDFTDPDAMPGFGPLAATDEVRPMVEQTMSAIGDATAIADRRGFRRSREAAGLQIDPASQIQRHPKSSASSATC